MKIVKNIIIVLLVIVAILWGISFLLTQKFTIERVVLISAPSDSVFSYVSNLKQWKYWNPWLVQDPNVKCQYYNDDGLNYRMRWKSKEIGNGEVTIIPYKSENRIAYSFAVEGFGNRIHGDFLFNGRDGSTYIKWIDHGDLGPSPLSKYYRIVVENTIGTYFDTGLQNLKSLLEKKSSSQSKLNKENG